MATGDACGVHRRRVGAGTDLPQPVGNFVFIQGLGFRVWGLGFRVWGLGFGVRVALGLGVVPRKGLGRQFKGLYRSYRRCQVHRAS